MNQATTIFSLDQMIDRLFSFLERCGPEDTIIFYEHFIGECSDDELYDEDFDSMFHDVHNLLCHDYESGELQRVVDAMFIGFGIKFSRTYQLDDEFVYEFNGEIR